MYIAMNRFKIKNGKEDTFEEIWKNRDMHLKNVPGFMKFHSLIVIKTCVTGVVILT